jgi:hypothetical protein
MSFPRVYRDSFDTTVVPPLHEAALKDALKAPTEFETILHALERLEVTAAVRDKDTLAMARLRGIDASAEPSPRTVVP